MTPWRGHPFHPVMRRQPQKTSTHCKHNQDQARPFCVGVSQFAG
jgi:hypothetical protein